MALPDDSNTPSARSRRSSTTGWRIAAGVSLAGAAGLAGFMILPGVGATPSGSVTICHATALTSNPYTVNTVNTSSVNEIGNQYLNGHGNHTGPVYGPGVSGWGDIIPAFEDGPSGTSFPGYNWGAAGQEIWGNGCQMPGASTSPAPVTTSPAPVTTSPAPTETSPAPTETNTSPAPTETSPAPITTSPAPTETNTSPAPITTSPAPTETNTSPAPVTPLAEPDGEPTVITSPTADGIPISPAPILTGDPNDPGNPGSGALPNSVPAGGDATEMAAAKPTWLWLLTAAFLAMLVASLHQLARARGEE